LDAQLWTFKISQLYAINYEVNNSPKKPFGAAIGVLKPNAQNIQAFVLSKPLQQFQKKTLQNDEDLQILFAGHPKIRSTNQRRRTAVILKNDKLLYLSKRLADFDDLHVI